MGLKLDLKNGLSSLDTHIIRHFEKLSPHFFFRKIWPLSFMLVVAIAKEPMFL